MDEGLIMLRDISRGRAKAILQEQVNGDLITEDLNEILSGLDKIEQLDEEKWNKLLNTPVSKLEELKKSITQSTREFEKRSKELDKILQIESYSTGLPDEYRRQAAYNLAFQNESELWMFGSQYLSDKQIRKLIRKQNKRIQLELQNKNNSSLMEDTMILDLSDESNNDLDILNQSFIEVEESDLENTEDFKFSSFLKLQNSEKTSNEVCDTLVNIEHDDIMDYSEAIVVEKNELENRNKLEIPVLENNSKMETTEDSTVFKNGEVSYTSIVQEERKISTAQDDELDKPLRKLLEIPESNTQVLEEIEIRNSQFNTTETESGTQVKKKLTRSTDSSILENTSVDSPLSVVNNYTQMCMEYNEEINRKFQRYPQYIVSEQLSNVTWKTLGELNENTKQKDESVVNDSYMKIFSKLKFHDVSPKSPSVKNTVIAKPKVKQSQLLCPSSVKKFKLFTNKANLNYSYNVDNSKDLTDDNEVFYDCVKDICMEDSIKITSHTNESNVISNENNENIHVINNIQTSPSNFEENKHSESIGTENNTENSTPSVEEQYKSMEISLEINESMPILDIHTQNDENIETETPPKSASSFEHYKHSEMIKPENNTENAIQLNQGSNNDTPKKCPVFKRKELPIHLKPQSQQVKEIHGERKERPRPSKRPHAGGVPEVSLENRFTADHVYKPKRWYSDYLTMPDCVIM